MHDVSVLSRALFLGYHRSRVTCVTLTRERQRTFWASKHFTFRHPQQYTNFRADVVAIGVLFLSHFSLPLLLFCLLFAFLLVWIAMAAGPV